jgi:hypothetical protein
MAIWNHPRATRDVDLLVGVDATEIDPVIQQLSNHGFRPRKSPPLVAIGTHHFAQFSYTPPNEFYDVQLDLILAESEFQKSAISRRVKCDVAGISRPVDVLNCDDLILMKLIAARIIDRADAAMLLRENRESIDFDYLLNWVRRLALTNEFSEIWREAYPGEDEPSLRP